MAGVRQQDELRAGNSLGDQRRVCGRNQPVSLAVNHERRLRDLRQATVGLPRENALKLRVIRFSSREPGTSNLEVLVDARPWRPGIVDERNADFSGLLG